MIRDATDLLRPWKLIEIAHRRASANKESQLYQLLRAYLLCRHDIGESIHAYVRKCVDNGNRWLLNGPWTPFGQDRNLTCTDMGDS